MNALVIDCAVTKISIAAKKDFNSVKLVLNIGSKQSEKLLPAIDYVLKECNLLPSELNYTALTIGPGSFTGLRLGLSALKALNLTYNIPIYGIPSLEAYSWPYRKSNQRIISTIEAKEDEFFYGFYQKGELIKAEEDKEINEILKEIDPESTLIACGPGCKTFKERAEELSSLHKIDIYIPENDACESLFEIAEKMIQENKNPLQDYDGPLYIRKSEAEIVLEKKQNEKN